MRVFDKILNAMCFVSKLIIAGLMFSVSLDVICRYLFNAPMVWVIPISEYALVYITFLGAAWLLREEGHVTMDTVTEKLSPAGRALFGLGGCVLGLVVSFIFVWYGTITTYDHFRRGIYESAVMEMPIAPILAIIPVGSFFLLIQFLRRSFKYIGMWKAARRGEATAAPEPSEPPPAL
jgi:TRAP-type C4-dicarboxylate transport system permease small subunit